MKNADMSVRNATDFARPVTILVPCIVPPVPAENIYPAAGAYKITKKPLKIRGFFSKTLLFPQPSDPAFDSCCQ